MSYLLVGIGGAIGSIFRYLLSSIKVQTDFPLMTFIVNILGAILIGIIVGFADKYKLNDNVVLCLKTGVCGGFTTFSSFSLETLKLFEDHNYLLGIEYVILSVILCFIGVFIGKTIICGIN